jgi:hypothetical protein
LSSNFARDEIIAFCDVVSKAMASYDNHIDMSITGRYGVQLSGFEKYCDMAAERPE